ncbi:restriction endonuclease subunit S [Nocardia cyriacigeorgica]|uniref:restriction endonuclease subunit S n=1 Tax=Nocardia cyriacigeorgica TaxID=135487 RepID=UPI00138AE9DC|nr:restriction endonuclease subunit S [Nocardia cyriacigeorgica]
MTSRLRGIGSSDNGGVRTPRINAEDLGDILVKLPELDEQRRIADFLDAETSRIGTIESARKRQMALLEESELATIGAMLGGRTEASRRRKTGWKWLPEIPEGWAIGPVYAYYDTELGKMLNAERAAGRNQRPYLRNANVGWYRISLNDVATMDFSPEEVLRYSLRSGDLLVCEGGAGVAEAAVWDGSIEECYFQKSLHRVRSRTNLPVEWLMYWLRYAKSCGVFEATGNVATIPHLTGEQLRRFRIPVPENSNDAIRITRDSIARSASLRELLAGMLDILSERRQALITAAVTGQFDVSTASGRNTTQGV